MEEIWKPVPGYEGKYEVSSLGNVRSLRYRNAAKTEILKPRPVGRTRGYLSVQLGRNKPCYIHRLVYEAFNGAIPDGMVVNHINEDKADNRVENLNVLTYSENSKWGDAPKKQSAIHSIGVTQYTLEGTFIRKWPSAAQIQRDTGFDASFINACCRGKYSQAYGYVWRR